ncbi:unnamed protein product [Parascedosporium putredinis]|uniref:Uncharacterized protein n=1 Tax=Parascedosporium putredinis TaxID=1442378 RepID=A0A9P1H7D7_9PEZI|nr:unnamed protein product [Parascedosporium putredinis]CAI7999580.1 unnamed protein product [Parascedosporium putredinis]
MASSSADVPAQQPADTETTPCHPLTDPGGLEAQLGSSGSESADRAAAIRASLVAGVWFASWALLSISGITIVLCMVLFSLNTFTSRNVWLDLDGWVVLALAAFFSGFLAIVNLRTVRAAKVPGLIWDVVINTAFVSGVILGWFVHPALVVFWFFKARTAYGSPGRRDWLIPAGALTFEFTIRFSRQPSDDQVAPPPLPVHS